MEVVYLKDIIKSTTAISPRAGNQAFDFVIRFLESSNPVQISFSGISDCSSAFCNSFIGRIYMKFDPAFVDEVIRIIDLGNNKIWANKLADAKMLGVNENLRSVRKSSLEELVLN
jgi:hypothetical protein